MKKIVGVKKTLGILLAAVIVMSLFTVPASAVTKRASHGYKCFAHSRNRSDMYVQLTATFSGKKATDVWWSESYVHWPADIKFGSTKKGNGYARGTYTISSGLLTQWLSLTFAKKTSTIYIYN